MSPVQMGQLPVEMPANDLLSAGLIPATETIFAPRPKDADDDMLQITGVDGKSVPFQMFAIKLSVVCICGV
jgi:hypothetical protein